MQTQWQDRQGQLENAVRRFRLLGVLALGMALTSVLLISRPTATAQSTTGEEESLKHRVAKLEGQVAALQQALAGEVAARQQGDAQLQAALEAERAARKQGDADTLAAAKAYTDEKANALSADVLAQAKAYTDSRVNPLADKLVHFSRVGSDVFITGANLHIRNGRGFTESTNGLGNLIVGYNEVIFSGGDERNGSHNLVVGVAHDYTSFGGLVVGYSNAIRAPYASVSCGNSNTANGPFSSISGGVDNTTNGPRSSISGGQGSWTYVEALCSVISGGRGNSIRGRWDTISGGKELFDGDDFGWVAGSQGDGDIFHGKFRSP